MDGNGPGNGNDLEVTIVVRVIFPVRQSQADMGEAANATQNAARLDMVFFYKVFNALEKVLPRFQTKGIISHIDFLLLLFFEFTVFVSTSLNGFR